MINYYEGIDQKSNNVANPNPASGTPIKTIVAQPSIDLGVRDAAGNTLGGVNPSFLPRAIPMMTAYAQNVGTTAGFPGSPFPEVFIIQTWSSRTRRSSTTIRNCSTVPTNTSGKTGRRTTSPSTNRS